MFSFIPAAGSRICWSEKENAIALVYPNGSAFVVDLSGVTDVMQLALNWDDDTLRNANFESAANTWYIRRGFELHHSDLDVRAFVVTNFPLTGAENIVAHKRGAVGELFGAMPAPVVTACIKTEQAQQMLESTNKWERYAGWHFLWKQQSWKALSSSLVDSDPIVQWWGAACVAGSVTKKNAGDNGALVSALARCLTTGDSGVQGMAWWALNVLRPAVKAASIEAWQVFRMDRSEAIAFLVRSLSRGRLAAVRPLGEIAGEAVIPPLLDSISKQNGVEWVDQHQKAISKLAGYPDVFWLSEYDALQSFWTMCRRTSTADIGATLKDSKPWVREAALLALGRRQGEMARLFLIDHGIDQHRCVEQARQTALRRRLDPSAVLDSEPAEIDTTLSNADLGSLYANTLNSVYIEKLKERGVQALPHLVRALGKWEPARGGTPPFLAYIVQQGDTALPALIEGVRNGDLAVKTWCVDALAKLQRVETVPLLYEVALANPGGYVTSRSRMALGAPWAVKHSIGLVLAGITNCNVNVRASSFSILSGGFRFGRVDPVVIARIESALITGLADPSPQVRQVAVQTALDFIRSGHIATNRVMPALESVRYF